MGYYAYNSSSGLAKPFVVSKSRAGWARAVAIRLPKDGAAKVNAELKSVACTSAAACVAVGEYTNRAGNTVPMAVVRSRGRWGTAIRLPVPAGALKSAGFTDPMGVACPKVGHCAVVGEYNDSHSAVRAWEVSESAGRFGKARAIRPPAKASSDPEAGAMAVACTGVGACTAVGGYFGRSGKTLAADLFAATESRSTWQQARQVSVLPAHPDNPADPGLRGVACPARGACVAVGQFRSGGVFLPMVIAQASGRWHARSVGLPADSAPSPQGWLTAIACWAKGKCVAVGYYVTSMDEIRPMAALSR